jgi:transcriptional regulator
VSSPFTDVPEDGLDALVAHTPLCWIVPHRAPEAAILMPVILQRDGSKLSLLGHLPRAAPATHILREDSRATFLFLGPHGYISPAMAGRQDWAPTWNFASARFTGRVTIDGALTRASVEALIAQMEGAAGWRIEELGPRADDLLTHIVGFIATGLEAAPRFKLAQDENAETFAAIVSSLEGTDLETWTTRYGRKC